QQTDRRNAENISEAVAGAMPRSLQRFLTESPWSDEPVIDRLQANVGRLLKSSDGVYQFSPDRGPAVFGQTGPPFQSALVQLPVSKRLTIDAG
ncbi:MAG TPA: hypothetical protein VM537_37320, partial [Anaerolineae bacterium]|nr:hypothetical protein [Anaerolineae bacterium]